MSGAQPGIAAKRSQAFRERAMLEADRYGPDPWIFVRELLQNSRDAGATAVDFTLGHDEHAEWICCYDDGEGMTFEHARRYLFALYASSKEDNARQAGKFGVGFWSVLRFGPVSITIRSRPRDGAAWGLRLDGALEHAEHVAPPQRYGTEIILARPLGDGRLEHRVFDAVRQSARYLCLRDQPERPLPVRISGRSANEPFALPAPSASFRRKHVRGVVGLGSAPRVELFSRGLRVRSAACLEDLVAPTGRHTSRMRVQFPELPGGLAPTALLESDSLEVMLSRSDARDDRALTKLVRLAQKELERLIDQQLAHARPQPWWRRGWDRGATLLRNSLAARTLAGASLGAVAAVAASLYLWGGSSTPAAATASGVPTQTAAAAVAGSDAARPYGDLGQRYRGPRVDVLAPGSAEPVDLRYAPSGTRLHFAALTFPRLSSDGSPVHDSIATAASSYAMTPPTEDAIEVSLPIRGTGRPLRIPVPTGHRIVVDSVFFDGAALAIRSSGEGHPVVTAPEGAVGRLHYKTAPTVDPTPVEVSPQLPRLPASLATMTEALKTDAIEDRVAALLATVVDRVAYDRTSEMAQRHAQAVGSGKGFIERTLDIGAGDCDVQNGLLVSLLQSAGVRSRLAVGYIGMDGTVLPWLHAWAEYLGEDGRWHVVDASERSGGAGAPVIAVASPPPSVAPPSPAGPRPTSPLTAPPRAPGKAIDVAPPDPAAGDDDGATVQDPAPSNEGSDGDESVAPAPETVAAVATPPEAPPSPTTPPPPPTPESMRARIVAFEAANPWLLPSGAIVLLILTAWGVSRSRTLRDVQLDDSTDLSRLLQGVLQQPAAFSHMASLFHRPLVPLLGGRALSLQRTRDLATKGRLYRSASRPSLARRAAKNGAAVLDVRTPEGATVADAVGAVDLDAWAALFDRAWTDPLADALNATLAQRKEPWRIRIGTGVPSRLASLDLAPLGVRLPGDSAARLVMIERNTPWWDELAASFAANPSTATFRALDQLAERLDLPEERRAPLLAAGAAAALLETFGA